MKENLLATLSSFTENKILVIGDIMLDNYWIGNVERISPESPVPIVDLKEVQHKLGGAANVALNLQTLGATPTLLGVIGDDEQGQLLINCMKQKQLLHNGIITVANRKTTVKTRVLGNNHQLLRIDSETKSDLTETQELKLQAKFDELVKNNKYDAIILEDYNKGVLTIVNIEYILAYCIKNNIPSFVDPKKNNFWNYANVTVFKPNWKESVDALQLANIEKNENNAIIVANTIKEKLNVKNCFITLAEKGIFILDENNKYGIYKTDTKQVVDVSGAGDTVIALCCLGFINNLNWEQISHLCNIGAGIVCNIAGVNPLQLKDLKEKINSSI